MARPPEGPNLADHLDLPDDTKHRLKVVLETISGAKTIAEASAELGIGAARFHELRMQALEGAGIAISPKPAGRPRSEGEAADPRVAELDAKLKDMEIEVKAAHVREQIARTMPHLLEDGPASEDTSQKKTKGNRSKVLDKINKGRKRPR
ncbi:MAG: hypothetical protein ACAI25_10105 [Planctomycetota bacterium]